MVVLRLTGWGYAHVMKRTSALVVVPHTQRYCNRPTEARSSAEETITVELCTNVLGTRKTITYDQVSMKVP